MNVFTYEADRWGPFEVHRVINRETQTGFSVAPQRGACLLSLHIQGRSLIDGYRNTAELHALDWAKSAILAPFPNRLKDGRFEWKGETFQFPINDVERGNALHGMVWDKPFEAIGIETLEKSAAMALEYRYGGDQPWFPFPFTLRVHYALTSTGEFEIALELENTGVRAMPAGLGWHPYFQMGVKADEMQLQLPPADQIEVDQRMIPTGEMTPFADFQQLAPIADAHFDTGFRLLNLGRGSGVLLKADDHHLHYWQDSHFPFLQVFIPPARQSIALEPMTCNIDAFNNGQGLIELQPRKKLHGVARVKI